MLYTDTNVLLGAPTGSGKTIAAEIAMFRVFNNTPHLKAQTTRLCPSHSAKKEKKKNNINK